MKNAVFALLALLCIAFSSCGTAHRTTLLLPAMHQPLPENAPVTVLEGPAQLPEGAQWAGEYRMQLTDVDNCDMGLLVETTKVLARMMGGNVMTIETVTPPQDGECFQIEGNFYRHNLQGASPGVASSPN